MGKKRITKINGKILTQGGNPGDLRSDELDVNVGTDGSISITDNKGNAVTAGGAGGAKLQRSKYINYKTKDITVTTTNTLDIYYDPLGNPNSGIFYQSGASLVSCSADDKDNILHQPVAISSLSSKANPSKIKVSISETPEIKLGKGTHASGTFNVIYPKPGVAVFTHKYTKEKISAQGDRSEVNVTVYFCINFTTESYTYSNIGSVQAKSLSLKVNLPGVASSDTIYRYTDDYYTISINDGETNLEGNLNINVGFM